jgi:hypothetical protein
MRSLFLRVFLWFGIAMVLGQRRIISRQVFLLSGAFKHLETTPWHQ